MTRSGSSSEIRVLPLYRETENGVAIDLYLESPDDLFVSGVPYPKPYLRANSEIEDYLHNVLVDVLRDKKHKTPLELVLWLPASEMKSGLEDAVNALIKRFCQERQVQFRREMREHWRLAWKATLYGLLFMTFCMLLRMTALHFFGDQNNLWINTFAEGMLVIGWVALWRPLELFLFDWFPIAQKLRINRWLQQASLKIKKREED